MSMSPTTCSNVDWEGSVKQTTTIPVIVVVVSVVALALVSLRRVDRPNQTTEEYSGVVSAPGQSRSSEHQLTLVASMPLTNAVAVVVAGDSLFVADSSRLMSYSIATGSSPILEDVLVLAHEVYTIAVDGSNLIVMSMPETYDSYGGSPTHCEVVDISNPEALKVSGEFDLPYFGIMKAMSGTLLIGQSLVDHQDSPSTNGIHYLAYSATSSPAVAELMSVQDADVVGMEVIGNRLAYSVQREGGGGETRLVSWPLTPGAYSKASIVLDGQPRTIGLLGDRLLIGSAGGDTSSASLALVDVSEVMEPETMDVLSLDKRPVSDDVENDTGVSSDEPDITSPVGEIAPSIIVSDSDEVAFVAETRLEPAYDTCPEYEHWIRAVLDIDGKLASDAEVHVDGEIWSLAVRANYLFVATNSGGVRVYEYE